MQPDFGLGVRATWYGLFPVARLLGLAFDFSVEWRAAQPRGPLVIAANHLSHLDPPVVGMALRHPIRFLALDELWGISRFLDAAFRAFHVIPLARTSYPLGAMRASLAHLAAGGRLGVFPEGRRVAAWGEAEPKRGAAWLSLRSGAPLLPVAIAGTERAMPMEQPLRLHRSPVRVVVGRPIDPAPYRSAEDPAGALTEAWRVQMDEELTYLTARMG